eukprot:249892-Alexandrium_andersonii.AAC.1
MSASLVGSEMCIRDRHVCALTSAWPERACQQIWKVPSPWCAEPFNSLQVAEGWGSGCTEHNHYLWHR